MLTLTRPRTLRHRFTSIMSPKRYAFCFVHGVIFNLPCPRMVQIKMDKVLQLFYFMPQELPTPRMPTDEEWGHIARHLGPWRIHNLIRFQARVRGGLARNLFPDLFRARQNIAIRMQYLWRRKMRMRKIRAAVAEYHMKLKRVYFRAIRRFAEAVMMEADGQKRRCGGATPKPHVALCFLPRMLGCLACRIARRHYWHTLKRRHVDAWLVYHKDLWADRRLLASIYRYTMVTNGFHRYLNSYKAHTYVRDQWRAFMELNARRRELWGHVFMLVADVNTHNSRAGRWRQYKYVCAPFDRATHS